MFCNLWIEYFFVCLLVSFDVNDCIFLKFLSLFFALTVEIIFVYFWCFIFFVITLPNAYFDCKICYRQIHRHLGFYFFEIFGSSSPASSFLPCFFFYFLLPLSFPCFLLPSKLPLLFPCLFLPPMLPLSSASFFLSSFLPCPLSLLNARYEVCRLQREFSRELLQRCAIISLFFSLSFALNACLGLYLLLFLKLKSFCFSSHYVIHGDNAVTPSLTYSLMQSILPPCKQAGGQSCNVRAGKLDELVDEQADTEAESGRATVKQSWMAGAVRQANKQGSSWTVWEYMYFFFL